MKLKVTKINDNLVHVRNGEVVLYKRGDSAKWQARYKLKDLKWRRVATKHANIRNPSIQRLLFTAVTSWARSCGSRYNWHKDTGSKASVIGELAKRKQ